MKVMKTIEEKIKSDPDLFYTFQANIAMAFKDEFARHNKEHGNKSYFNEYIALKDKFVKA